MTPINNGHNDFYLIFLTIILPLFYYYIFLMYVVPCVL